MFEINRTFIISTPIDMYNFMNAIHTHSEYRTEFDLVLENNLRTLTEKFGVYDSSTPDVEITEIEGGKVNVKITYHVWNIPTEKVLEVEGSYHNGFDEVITYIIAQTNLDIPMSNLEEN